MTVVIAEVSPCFAALQPRRHEVCGVDHHVKRY